jgi:hypothetical protein
MGNSALTFGLFSRGNTLRRALGGAYPDNLLRCGADLY